MRESIHSERPPTIRSVTHASEAPLHYDEHRGDSMHQDMHYEQHHGAPVTAVHDEDPYSPFDDGESAMNRPGTINIRPASNAHGGGGGYFGGGYQDSPRNTIIRASGVHDHHFDHAEPMHQQEHVTPAGSSGQMSRQPVIELLAQEISKTNKS